MTPEEYRRLARDCERTAEATTDPLTKRTYEELARRWRVLADDIERYGMTRGIFEF